VGGRCACCAEVSKMPADISPRTTVRPIVPATPMISTTCRFMDTSFAQTILVGFSNDYDGFYSRNRASVIIDPAEFEGPAFLDFCRELQIRIGCHSRLQS